LKKYLKLEKAITLKLEKNLLINFLGGENLIVQRGFGVEVFSPENHFLFDKYQRSRIRGKKGENTQD
jgi:hypothetical protein